MTEALRKPAPEVEVELDERLDRVLKLSDAELQRRLKADYPGELLALKGFEEMARPEPGVITIDVGITGTGKSTWLKVMLARWLKDPSTRVVAWDHLDELSIYGRASPYRMMGPLPKRVTMDQLREHEEMLDEPELRIAVVPTRRGADGRAKDFRDLVDLLGLEDLEREDEVAEAMGNLPYLFCIEETGRVAEFCLEEFKVISTVGRHSGVSVIAVAQWAAAIPHPLRRQARVIVAHGQDWDIDIDALADPMGRELAETVRGLPDHQRVIWDRDAAHRGSSAA